MIWKKRPTTTVGLDTKGTEMLEKIRNFGNALKKYVLRKKEIDENAQSISGKIDTFENRVEIPRQRAKIRQNPDLAVMQKNDEFVFEEDGEEK